MNNQLLKYNIDNFLGEISIFCRYFAVIKKEIEENGKKLQPNIKNVQAIITLNMIVHQKLGMKLMKKF